MRRVVVLALVAGLWAGGCTSEGPTDPPPAGATTGSTGSSPSSPGTGSALNATQAPLLPTDAQELPDVDPQSYEELLAQLRGTPVLVNVWGAWCPPCRAEAPALGEVSEEYGERVQFLGIDILDDRASARAFMTEFGWRYPSLFDLHGRVRDHLGFIGQPITLIYDADGELVSTTNGEISESRLRSELEKVV